MAVAGKTGTRVTDPSTALGDENNAGCYGRKITVRIVALGAGGEGSGRELATDGPELPLPTEHRVRRAESAGVIGGGEIRKVWAWSRCSPPPTSYHVPFSSSRLDLLRSQSSDDQSLRVTARA